MEGESKSSTTERALTPPCRILSPIWRLEFADSTRPAECAEALEIIGVVVATDVVVVPNFDFLFTTLHSLLFLLGDILVTAVVLR